MSASRLEPQISILQTLRAAIPAQLPAYLEKQRWFGGKARQIRSSELIDVIPFQQGGRAFFLLARVEYETGPGDTYVLPVFSHIESTGSNGPESDSALLILENAQPGPRLVLTDALQNPEFLLGLLQAVKEESFFQGWKGELRSIPTSELQRLLSSSGLSLTPKLLKGEQSNSSIVFGEELILKIFRRLDAGMNPDLEIGIFLTEKARFKNIPPVAGSLEYLPQNGPSATVGILQGFVPNQGDAWRFTLRHLAAFWKEVCGFSPSPKPSSPSPLGSQSVLPEMEARTIPSLPSYLDAVGLLGKRTAEMHQALSSDSSDPAFAPEPYSAQFQSSLESSIRDLTERNFALLRQKKNGLPQEARPLAEKIIGCEAEILQRIHSTFASPIETMRIRIHGDYHLGQVLYTGSDFIIIDFEGEPARSWRNAVRNASRFKMSLACCDRSIMLRSPPGWLRRPERIART